MIAQFSPRQLTDPTPVVTVFLTSQGKVALFRRSARVGTYQGAWAGISGYIERLPLEQAYVELQEEASLSRNEVDLCGIGIPVLVRDENLGRTWAVYPFLFSVHNPRNVRIDWEAEEMKWVVPGELQSMDTVPGLEKALASVWPRFADSEYWGSLGRISLDIKHGATSLALSGLGALGWLLERDSSIVPERAIRALAACRPSMGIFAHLAARLLIDRETTGSLSNEITEATAASADHAAKGLSSYRRILTTSYSSAVKEALLSHRRNMDGIEVIVAESRPELEGVTLARELAQHGINTSVITDSQVGLFMSEVDAVVVGADAITENDEIANKAGTSLLALAARSRGVPCFAVTQTFKIVPPGFPHMIEEQEPDRVGRAPEVRFRNLIFDLTPISLFDAVYTESGVLTDETLSFIRSHLDGAFT